MAYTIERAKTGDEGAFAFIQTECWKAGFREILSPEVLAERTRFDKIEQMYRSIIPQAFANGYLLRVDGEPQCMAWWSAARADNMPGYGEVICIHSLPGRWRQGFGGLMMDRVLADMAEAGYEKVMLWVFEDNHRARAFYESKGFHTEGMPKPDSDPKEICYLRTL